MSDDLQGQPEPALPERKKISLQEAVKQKLAKQKEMQNKNKGFAGNDQQQYKMKSQLTKKPNNQRRRTGV